MRGVLIILPALLFIIRLSAQQPGTVVQKPDKKRDSLQMIIKNAKPDTSKLLAIYELGKLAIDSNRINEIQQYGNDVLELSQQLNYKRGTGLAYYLFGYYYYKKSDTYGTAENISKAMQILEDVGDKKNLALSYTLQIFLFLSKENYAEIIYFSNKAFPVFQQVNDKLLLWRLFTNMSTSYYYLGNFPKSLEYNLKAEKQAEELYEKRFIAYTYQNIGANYMEEKDDSMALYYLQKAATVNRLIPAQKFSLLMNYSTMADIYTKQGIYQEALVIYEENLKKYQLPGAPKWGVPQCYAGIGLIYEKRGDSALNAGNRNLAKEKYLTALKNHQQAYDKLKPLGNDGNTADKAINTGRTYMKLANPDEARKYLQIGLNLSLKFGYKTQVADAYLYLAKTDSIAGNYKSAYHYFNLHTIYKDSIYNAENARLFQQNKMEAAFEKKEKEIEILSTQNNLNAALAQQQKQRKNFAWIIAALILSAAFYAFFRYRRFSRNKSEQKTLHDRLQISQDLHDNVGSTLSSISVFSKVAQKQGEQNNNEEMQEVLGRISETSNEMVSEMNDIVWAINPKNDSMERIIQRIESFAKPMLATRNISFNLSYEPSLVTASLDMEKRKNFYLIFKEAVNNAFKYSGCSEIKTIISNSNKQIKMTIKDNGVGFDVKRESAGKKLSLSGNGLRNMKSRAVDMKGELLIESMPGEGTEIKLSFPIP